MSVVKHKIHESQIEIYSDRKHWTESNVEDTEARLDFLNLYVGIGRLYWTVNGMENYICRKKKTMVRICTFPPPPISFSSPFRPRKPSVRVFSSELNSGILSCVIKVCLHVTIFVYALWRPVALPMELKHKQTPKWLDFHKNIAP